MRGRHLFVPLAVLSVVGVACGGDDDESSGGASDGSSPAAEGDLVVFADTSLSDVFTDIGLAFESESGNDDVVPEFTFDASQALVQEIVDGTPAGVFASADAADMDALAEAERSAAEPVVFATNAMTIVVPVGNPDGVEGLADLADLDVVLCVEEAPCGRYAQEVLEKAGVSVTPASTADNTDEVVAMVEDGEAAAGIVYATDLTASGDAESVLIPVDANVLVEYSIAAIADSETADLDQAFIEYVTGPAGQELLEQYNFGPPA